MGVLAGLGLILGLGVAAGATPASALVWSGRVTVTGAVNQCSGNHTGGIQTATVNAVLNGQRVIDTTNLGGPPNYSVTFTNVPSGSGGWAWIVATCENAGGSQGYWVHVYRPLIGSTLRVNLG